jgi:hypothetical protein
MPADLRQQLQKAAIVHGRSVSQELLRRVQDSFHRDRDRVRAPAMLGLCFLIAQLACEVSGFVTENGTPMYDWRSVPFFFRAFKLAVGHLLEAIEPRGEICPPAIQTIVDGEKNDALREALFSSYQSPDARAKVAAETVLRLLHRKEPKMEGFASFDPYLSSEAYGYWNARQDLQAVKRRDLTEGQHLFTRMQASRSILKEAFKRPPTDIVAQRSSPTKAGGKRKT